MRFLILLILSIYGFTKSSISQHLTSLENEMIPNHYYVENNSNFYSVPEDHWPDCWSPKRIYLSSTPDNSCLLSWDGEKASMNGVRYQVQYSIFKDGAIKSRHKEMICQGTSCSLGSVPENSRIYFQIRSICDGFGDQFSFHGKWVYYIIENEQVSSYLFNQSSCDHVESAMVYHANGTQLCWTIPNEIQYFFEGNSSYCEQMDSNCRNTRNCSWLCSSIESLDSLFLAGQKSFCQWIPVGIDSVAFAPVLSSLEGSMVLCDTSVINIHPPSNACELAPLFKTQVLDHQLLLFLDGIDSSLVHQLLFQEAIDQVLIDIRYYDDSIENYTQESFIINPGELLNHSWHYLLPVDPANYNFEIFPVELYFRFDVGGEMVNCPGKFDVSPVDIGPETSIFCQFETFLESYLVDSNSLLLQFENWNEAQWQYLQQQQQITGIHFNVQYTAWTDCNGETFHLVQYSDEFNPETWAVLLNDLQSGVQQIQILISYWQAGVKKFCLWSVEVDVPSYKGTYAEIKSQQSDCDSLDNPPLHFCDLLNYLNWEWLDDGSELSLSFAQIDQHDFAELLASPMVESLQLNIHFSNVEDIDPGLPERIINIPLDGSPPINSWGYIIGSIPTDKELITIELVAEHNDTPAQKTECLQKLQLLIPGIPGTDHPCEYLHSFELSDIGADGLLISTKGLDEAFVQSLQDKFSIQSLQLTIEYIDTQSDSLVIIAHDWIVSGEVQEIADWSEIIYHFDQEEEIIIRWLVLGEQDQFICDYEMSFSVEQQNFEPDSNPDIACQYLDFINPVNDLGHQNLYLEGISMAELLQNLALLEIANFNFRIEYVDSISGEWEIEIIDIVLDGHVVHQSDLLIELTHANPAYPVEIFVNASNADQSIQCSDQKSIHLNDDIDPDNPNVALACLISDFIFASSSDAQSVQFYISGITVPQFNQIIAENDIDEMYLSIEYWDAISDQSFTQIIHFVEEGQILHSADWEFIIEQADLSVDILTVLYASSTSSDTECSQIKQFSLGDILDEDSISHLEELPLLECGNVQESDSIINVTPLQSLEVGQIIQIAKFPVLVNSVEGSSGIFSGTGVVRLPFGNKAVAVEFSNIRINELLQVFEGEIVALQDHSSNYPDFTMDTLSLGSEICIPSPEPGMNADGIDPVTGLDPYGFDPSTGLHSVTGELYDENGFDINGNHIDTGTAFNSDGCNREGIDIEGNPCDPSSISSPLVNQFIDSITQYIPAYIADCTQEIASSLQDTLDQLSIECAELRSEMQNLVQELAFNQNWIFGNQDQFFTEGMHQQFVSEPQTLQLETPERIAEAKELEYNHVQLYHCDRGKLKVEFLLETLNNYSTEDLLNIILELLGVEATSYLVENVFNDPVKFKQWIHKKIAELLADDYQKNHEEDLGYHQNWFHHQDHLQESSIVSANPAMLFGALGITQAFLAEARLNFHPGSVSSLKEHLNSEIYNPEDQIKINTNSFWKLNPTDSAALMPLKLSREIEGRSLNIYLDQLRINPQGALVNAYFVIDDPGSGKRIVFEGHDIQFSSSGLSAPSQLSLVTTVEIRLNNAAKLILNANEQSFVKWDCQGFHSMQADLSIEFCREFIKPVDPLTKQLLADPERVRVNLVIEMFDWMDFTTSVSVPTFVINKQEDMVWTITDAVIDLSDHHTPALPLVPGYTSPFKIGNGLGPAWKGFQLGSLQVCLPQAFQNADEFVTVGAQDVLIDGCGVTAEIFAENLISIENGNADGWAFSMNEFSLLVLHNHLSGGSFKGEINVPVFQESFDYEATIFPNNYYAFKILPEENLTMDLWLARAEIFQNSTIEMQYENGQFHAVATLNGHLNIDPSGLDLPLVFGFPELKFSGLQVSNQAPYFSPGVWSYETNTTSFLKGFDCGLNGIHPYSNAIEEAGLLFDLDIILAPVQLIKGSGSFKILGKLETDEGIQQWVFDRVAIDDIYVNSSFPGAQIEGVLSSYDSDPIFGDGFRGSLAVNFDFLPQRMTALGQFGILNEFKYFMVDALADVNIPFGGGFKFKGFGGGIYYRMAANSESTLNMVASEAGIPPLGESLSGVIYTPDISRGMGFKGLAVISTYQENIFNGTVGLDVSFNESDNGALGGLAEVALRGTGKFLTGVDFDIPAFFDPLAMNENSDIAGPSIAAKLSAYIDIAYNFNQGSFDGLLAAYLNAGPLQGIGSYGRLCQASLHFGPDNWYIWLGKPSPRSERCGALLDVGILEAELSAYLNMGTKIPPFPQIQHPQMREIASRLRLNESLRNSGAGIMFGADFSTGINATVAGTGVEVNAGVGFDLMLRKFEEAYCLQTGNPIGIDGWYAIGQIWAFLEAQLKIIGIPIFSAGIAAALHARGPNPFYAHALLRIRACALLYCKTFNIGLSLGDDCILTSNEPNDELGIKVISYLDPLNQTTGVPTDTELHAFFSLGLNESYKMENLQGQEVEFVAKLAYTKLRAKDIEIPGIQSLYNGGRSLKFTPKIMLPGNDTLQFIVAVDIYKNGEFLLTETDSCVFYTTSGYDHIPESNVLMSYPLNGMYNFHKEEYKLHKAYIYLKSGQPDIFFEHPEGTVNKIKLSRGNGEAYIFDFEYDPLYALIEFALEPDILINNELYKLEIIRIPENEAIAYTPGSGYNAGPIQTEVSLGKLIGLNIEDGTEVNNDPQNQTSQYNSTKNKVLYCMYFRVSEFDRFKDKIEQIMSGDSEYSVFGEQNQSTSIHKSTHNIEYFSRAEFPGDKTYDALIQFSNSLESPWYTDEIYPLVYENAPITEGICDMGVDEFYNHPNYLSEESLGTVIEGGSFSQLNALEVSEHEFVNGLPAFDFEQRLSYQLAKVAQSHYNDQYIDASMCEYILTQDFDASGGADPAELIPDTLQEFLDSTYPDLLPGNYEVDISYSIPGRGQTSSFTITFINPED